MAERIRGHIGNGTVYLRGWINVDLPDSGSALASDCPAGVEKWGTDETDYYRNLKHIDALLLGEGTPDHESTVTDRYGEWSALPFEDQELDDLWSVQCWEHLSRKEARHAMTEAHRVLKIGGTLTLDVPDHEASLEEHSRLKIEAYLKSGEERIEARRKAAFMMRHLLGSRKSDYGFHMGSWTKQQLINFCRPYGFSMIRENENFHFYPAISLTFQKQPACDFPELDEPIRPWKAAWEYCGESGGPLTVSDNRMLYVVLEVGPGSAPWPRANFYCDIVDRPGLNQFSIGDVQSLPYDDKSMDFVLTSHVLEHVADPVRAASELSRVAHTGCVVCPSAYKEGLFAFHELDHKWNVFKSGDTLYFKRIPDGLYAALYDADVSSEMHRLWRYGDRRLEGMANKAKRWMHGAEPMLDVIHHWRGELKVKVLE